MARPKTIRVFEHQRLRYGDTFADGAAFSRANWEALVRYNEQHGNRFFTPIYRGIQFSQYVGVIQVGGLTIEVLPKADRPENPAGDAAIQQCWHDALLQMLRYCQHLRLENAGDADLRLRHWSLQDLYLDMFLTETEHILHRGLTRQYRREEGNRKALKGSLQFSHHLTRNMIHRERFFVRHQVYDRQHLLHQLLYKTLRLIPEISLNSDLTDRVGRLLFAFPEMPDLSVTEKTFAGITYDRKTEHYRRALELARLILLYYSPDIRGGANNVLAILFDMNELFEEYVYQSLRRAAPPGMEVRRQVPRLFWESRRIKPDIVIRWQDRTVVLDTKWKVINSHQPADSDLKQMYVYHRYFDAPRTILLYPQVYPLEPKRGWFRKEADLACEIGFVKVLNENRRLNRSVGEEIVKGYLLEG